MRRALWNLTVAPVLVLLFAIFAIFAMFGTSGMVPIFESVAAAQDRGDSRRIIQLDEEVVEGRIEKPEAFYILQPTNLTYEEATQQESFIPELLRTVEQDPF